MTPSHRLPRHTIPTRYDLRLEPDLTACRFTGEVTVTITVREPTAELLLNAAELEIPDATMASEAGQSYRGSVELAEAEERCCIRFPQTLMPGTWRLRLSFRGILNDKLRGFYRSTYKNEAGETRLMAATQFEATDARRAFPCWDEPDFKAIFSTTLVLDPSLAAISNTAVARERREDGKKVLLFADTIRMSTYLVAFIVGELEAPDPVMVGHTPLRIWCVPGKRRLAQFATEIGAFSLRFFEDYYGLPYPGDKLDLVAIPDFASGAMENLGAITFRETALLVDEQAATHAELERIADVVAHENAHMWFGDLVTMSWWNGLWLNEAFATFMEMLAVDAWKPEWQRWTTFGVSRAAALAVDGLHSSRPIEYEVRAPREADAMFDVLTYEKGASVLRMLEQDLGPQVFREGVRGYLRAHAYDNADTKDLWIALGEAADRPVPVVMDGWIFAPGYPLLTVGLDQSGQILISQQRFTYLGRGDLPEAVTQAVSGAPVALAHCIESAMGTPSNGYREQRWQVPVQLAIMTRGRREVRRVLLTDSAARVELPADFGAVLVNEGGHGFYRVRYGPDLLARLIKLLPGGLPAIERFNLINDAWALALAGQMPITEYLDLTAHFAADRDKNVWAVLVESFHFLNRVIEPSERPALEAFVRSRVGPAVAMLGWHPKPGEDELARQLRGDLIRALGTIGNDRAIQTEAGELYTAAATKPAAVDANVLPALIAILAHTGDAARYDEFLQRFRAAGTPQEERRYLYALAAFQPEPLLQDTLARAISGEIRTQDAPFIVRLLLLSVYGRGITWRFIKANWDTMDRLFPRQGLRRMCEGVIGLATPEWERDVHRLFDERKIELGGKTLAQYLEQLRIAVAFRMRTAAELRPYLARVGARNSRATV